MKILSCRHCLDAAYHHIHALLGLVLILSYEGALDLLFLLVSLNGYANAYWLPVDSSVKYFPLISCLSLHALNL